MNGYTYIMTNQTNKVFYIGATANLVQRAQIHRERMDLLSFTARYRVNKLVYFEWFENLEYAFNREKQLKRLGRDQKIRLIDSLNPEWKDLFPDICKDSY
ncbi:MAG: GIY-YIG nuclease family protein [bacterium]